jgi:hypothetical protein
MKLSEVVNLEARQRAVELMKLNAQRQAKQSKAAQSQLKIQKARAKVRQAQQELLLAIRAASQAS